MTEKIHLEPHELNMAFNVGHSRQFNSMLRGRQDRYGLNDCGWKTHRLGACGELAAAKALGIYWDGSVDTFSGPDLPGFPGARNIQVRTRSETGYELIVRPKDSDVSAFIVVVGDPPDMEVRGWIKGCDAKQESWLKTYGGRPPAYFVPNEHLRPISELRQKLLSHTLQKVERQR